MLVNTPQGSNVISTSWFAGFETEQRHQVFVVFFPTPSPRHSTWSTQAALSKVERFKHASRMFDPCRLFKQYVPNMLKHGGLCALGWPPWSRRQGLQCEHPPALQRRAPGCRAAPRGRRPGAAQQLLRRARLRSLAGWAATLGFFGVLGAARSSPRFSDWCVETMRNQRYEGSLEVEGLPLFL